MFFMSTHMKFSIDRRSAFEYTFIYLLLQLLIFKKYYIFYSCDAWDNHRFRSSLPRFFYLNVKIDINIS